MSTTTPAADTALAVLVVARLHLHRCVDAVNDAKAAQRAAANALDEATYLSTIAVVCPACSAQVGEPCRYPAAVSLHRYVTHGLRREATGEFGPERAAKAIAYEDRRVKGHGCPPC